MLLPTLDSHTALVMTALLAWSLVGVLALLGRGFWKQGVPGAMAAAGVVGVTCWWLALHRSPPDGGLLTLACLGLAAAISLMTLCLLRFRQSPWGVEDGLVLAVPWVLMAVTWLAAMHRPDVLVRVGAAILAGQMVYQMLVLRRTRGSASGKGWWTVLAAQVVQLVSLLSLVGAGWPFLPPGVPSAAAGGVSVLPWAWCMAGFLSLPAAACGYLRMLYDRRSELERKAAGLDSLTQLPSRRTLMGHAPSAMEQSAVDGKPLGLLLLDIDHFKKVNDMYGHLAGDAVIQRVAWVLRNQIRQEDFVARYGGEEFVVLLPNATPAIVLHTAQRIADAVRAEAVPVDHARVRVTVSLGGHLQQVTPGLRWEELLSTADAALYEAKHDGRDRVVLSAVCRAQLAPASPEPGQVPPRRGPEAGERRDDATRH